jgi:hypothetical protein
MVKKGKFKLFSFLIEKYLIYYKSLNKNNKLIAFSILEINNLLQILPFLNEFLLNNFLFYYSIQINVPNSRKIIIVLTFISNDKSKIDKFFNLVFQKIKEYNKSISFFKNHKLERHFFQILSNKLNIDMETLKMGDSLTLKQGEKLQFLDFYEINCDFMLDQKVSLHNLIKALNNFNHKGYVIFNFKTKTSEEIISNSYFIDVTKTKDYLPLNIEEEINTLFNCEVLKKSVPHINRLNCILWRTNFSDKFYDITKDSDLFLSLSQYNFHDLSKFSVQFEKVLRLNQVDFHRLKPNLFFIEDKILFLILEYFNPVEIKNILEKFYSKYYVFILILNMEEYNNLINSNEINLMDNIKILNFKDFIKLNINELKHETLLEYS